jgi:hypothetical protein
MRYTLHEAPCEGLDQAGRAISEAGDAEKVSACYGLSARCAGAGSGRGTRSVRERCHIERLHASGGSYVAAVWLCIEKCICCVWLKPTDTSETRGNALQRRGHSSRRLRERATMIQSVEVSGCWRRLWA